MSDFSRGFQKVRWKLTTAQWFSKKNKLPHMTPTLTRSDVHVACVWTHTTCRSWWKVHKGNTVDGTVTVTIGYVCFMYVGIPHGILVMEAVHRSTSLSAVLELLPFKFSVVVLVGNFSGGENTLPLLFFCTLPSESAVSTRKKLRTPPQILCPTLR